SFTWRLAAGERSCFKSHAAFRSDGSVQAHDPGGKDRVLFVSFRLSITDCEGGSRNASPENRRLAIAPVMAGSPRSVACGRQASGGPYENLRRPRAYGQNRRRTGQRIGPCDDLKPTVLMFGKRGATLHPVTAVHIADAVLAA